MEILINELSLSGQFISVEEFINISLSKFVRIYSLLEKRNINPLKNYNFYNLYICLTIKYKLFMISFTIRNFKGSVNLLK